MMVTLPYLCYPTNIRVPRINHKREIVVCVIVTNILSKVYTFMICIPTELNWLFWD